MSNRRNGLSDDPLWYKDAVFYELRVRSFYDSNGDGIGDFAGLTAKLDYLQDLGVTALWLLPFYPSPMRDDGYDTADYTDVNPDLGTLEDFKTFLAEAHRRGLRVVTELVINHTSDQHPWFQRARRAPIGSPERDFYVWSDTPDRYNEVRIIFQDFEPSNWSWDPVAKQYYWHRFFSHQPDLNFDNPAVQQAVKDALDFWMELGVDGLRLDAIPYLYEREGTNGENLPETHVFLRELRSHVDSKFKNRMFLAEANQWPEDVVQYLGPEECHMGFHFPIMPRMYMAVKMEDRFPIMDILAQTPALHPTCQWALFLRNHDELTLEMVTDEERDYMYKAFAREQRMRVNVGIRRRFAPLMGNDRRSIELLNGLLFSMPGTPVLYYGDEIGMGDNVYLGDRDSVRTPMQWSGDRNAGFSRANPQKLVLPTIIDPEYHFETVNVEAQESNPNSLLWWTKRLIALRKQHKAFGHGEIEFLQPDNPKILAFIRSHEDQRILVVANLSRHLQYVELDLSAFEGMVPVELFGKTHFPPIGELPYLLTLTPHSFAWFALEKPEAGGAKARAAYAAPVLHVETWPAWENGPRGDARTALEGALPAWLHDHVRGLPLGTRGTRIVDVLQVPGAPNAAMLLVRLGTTENEHETLLVPLAFATGEAAGAARLRWPAAIVAELESEAGTGVVYDALADESFHRALLDAIESRVALRGASGRAVATLSPVHAATRGEGPLDPRIIRGDHRNLLVAHGDRMVVKLFRRLDEGPNPEVEVHQALSSRGFGNVPAFAGQLDYRPERGPAMTLALLQSHVVHQGDAWHHAVEEVKRFYERALSHRDAMPSLPVRPMLERLLGPAWPHPEIRELMGIYPDSAFLLGRRTAEMHHALVAPTDDPALAPEPYSTLYQRSVYQSMRNLTGQVLRTLRSRIGTLPEETRADAKAVVASEERLLASFGKFLNRRLTTMRARVHGDLHLTQVLHTGKDFVFIDFEGDRTRTLSDRRRKRSPIRDAAGLVRSFHYAAHTEIEHRADPREREQLLPWADAWHASVAWSFLRGYEEAAAKGPFYPQDREEMEVQLQAFLLEKALDEIGYELANRPDWLGVPLRAILRLLGPTP